MHCNQQMVLVKQ